MQKELQYQLNCPELPLAVYREVAAHLRQVQGVKTSLILQRSPQFDYQQSQTGGLSIQYSDSPDAGVQERVKQILEYYQNRYGAWQEVSS
ncbi:MAG: hypothetical protein WA919_24480 [Coleofasciculaceae cyanobacterium]